jgi:tRNA U34 5-methylaminomethyl-2-thiouridine-forming methyltransferase MnmC
MYIVPEFMSTNQENHLNNSTVNKSRLRRIMHTEDGSLTLHVPDVDETYHSKHGAVQESMHVFIENGLLTFAPQPLRILEVGFGTGLNLILTFLHAEGPIHYTALEPFPLEPDIIHEMQSLYSDNQELFISIHDQEFKADVMLKPGFVLRKERQFLQQFCSESKFDLIYFDAFGPRVEPDLWNTRVLQRCFNLLKPGGVWVSYCAKGEVRRSLQEVGFLIERLPGPPGKREMLRARKPLDIR